MLYEAGVLRPACLSVLPIPISTGCCPKPLRHLNRGCPSAYLGFRRLSREKPVPQEEVS